MLELTLRVSSAEVEEVLDGVLPALPGGVHLRDEGGETWISIYATRGTPGEDELRRLAGPGLLDLTTTEVSGDWRERRRERYEPVVVAERFLLRPDWAPPNEDPDLIEIVLEPTPAFGTGLHPTTQACLAALAECEPGGSLADYGCGSGVLSIGAAKLGWSRVLALDVDEGSVATAARNAEANGVELEARRIDLTAEAPPPAETVLANVPPHIHVAVAERTVEAPRQLIASGFHPDETPAVAAAWERLGLSPHDEVRANEWAVLVLR